VVPHKCPYELESADPHLQPDYSHSTGEVAEPPW